jgi:Flp pilus assembly protein TadD
LLIKLDVRAAAVFLAAVACSSPKPPVPPTDLSRARPEVAPKPESAEPEEPEKPARRRAIEVMNGGVEAFGAGDHERAVAAFEEAMAIDPSFATSRYNLGQVLLVQGHSERAREVLVEAARLDPNDPMIQMRLGEALVRLGKFREGLNALNAAPEDSDRTHLFRGEAHKALGEYRAAARELTRSCQLAPERLASYTRLGELYVRFRETAAAVAVYEVAAREVTGAKERLHVYHDLGVSLSRAGRVAEAVAAFNAVLAADPKDTASLIERGFAYKRLGDHKRAIADLEAYLAAGGDGSMFMLQAAREMLATLRLRRRGTKATIPAKPTLAATALPPVPELRLPAHGGGPLSVKRLQVERERHLDTDVEVAGVIVWIYDCEIAVRKAGESRRAARKRIAARPELCARPHFILGDTTGSRPGDGLWVVEVPRPMRPDEKKNLDEETQKSWPAVPTIKVGDRVVVEGRFALSSPRGFRDSDGLLIYKALRRP